MLNLSKNKKQSKKTLNTFLLRNNVFKPVQKRVASMQNLDTNMESESQLYYYCPKRDY